MGEVSSAPCVTPHSMLRLYALALAVAMVWGQHIAREEELQLQSDLNQLAEDMLAAGEITEEDQQRDRGFLAKLGPSPDTQAAETKHIYNNQSADHTYQPICADVLLNACSNDTLSECPRQCFDGSDSISLICDFNNLAGVHWDNPSDSPFITSTACKDPSQPFCCMGIRKSRNVDVHYNTTHMVDTGNRTTYEPPPRTLNANYTDTNAPDTAHAGFIGGTTQYDHYFSDKITYTPRADVENSCLQCLDKPGNHFFVFPEKKCVDEGDDSNFREGFSNHSSTIIHKPDKEACGKLPRAAGVQSQNGRDAHAN